MEFSQMSFYVGLYFVFAQSFLGLKQMQKKVKVQRKCTI